MLISSSVEMTPEEDEWSASGMIELRNPIFENNMAWCILFKALDQHNFSVCSTKA
jgi:hypothetical protein